MNFYRFRFWKEQNHKAFSPNIRLLQAVIELMSEFQSYFAKPKWKFLVKKSQKSTTLWPFYVFQSCLGERRTHGTNATNSKTKITWWAKRNIFGGLVNTRPRCMMRLKKVRFEQIQLLYYFFEHIPATTSCQYSQEPVQSKWMKIYL